MLAVPTVFMLAPLSCTEPGSKPLEVSLDFVEEELSVPINGSASAVLEVEPESRLSEVEYSLADTDVVEIGGVASDDGKMTVVLINKGNIGSTTLVAILDDKMASCRISVSPVEVSGISINPESSDLFVGEELYLT